MRNALHTAAHLAAWAGMYVAASVVCLSQVSGLDLLTPRPARAWVAAFAFCLAVAVYLLDRVKLRDAWLDPADAQAHPRRFLFLVRRTRPARRGIAALLVAATLAGAWLSPWGAAIPALSCAGVLLYAARPRGARPRPKDILGIKNLYIAGGITGFATLTALAAASPSGSLAQVRALVGAHALPIAIAAAHLIARVFADAALCDLDDERADSAHGTRTLPGLLGRKRAWDVAMLIRLSLAAALAGVAVFTHGVLPRERCLWWAGVTAVSSVALRLRNPAKVRDLVDARFAVEAAIVTLAGAL